MLFSQHVILSEAKNLSPTLRPIAAARSQLPKSSLPGFRRFIVYNPMLMHLSMALEYFKEVPSGIQQNIRALGLSLQNLTIGLGSNKFTRELRDMLNEALSFSEIALLADCAGSLLRKSEHSKRDFDDFVSRLEAALSSAMVLRIQMGDIEREFVALDLENNPEWAENIYDADIILSEYADKLKAIDQYFDLLIEQFTDVAILLSLADEGIKASSPGQKEDDKELLRPRRSSASAESSADSEDIEKAYNISDPDSVLTFFFPDLGEGNIDRICELLKTDYKGGYEMRGNYIDGFEPSQIPGFIGVIIEFVNYILENYETKFLGGKLVFLGGSCNWMYVIAKILAPAYGIEEDDIILIEMPTSLVLSKSIQRKYDYLVTKKLFEGDKPLLFIDNGWEGRIPNWLIEIIEEKRSHKVKMDGYIMSSGNEEDSIYPAWESDLHMRYDEQDCTRAFWPSTFVEGDSRFTPRQGVSTFSRREDGSVYVKFSLNSRKNIINAWHIMKRVIMKAERSRTQLVEANIKSSSGGEVDPPALVYADDLYELKLPEGCKWKIYKIRNFDIYHIEFATSELQNLAFKRYGWFQDGVGQQVWDDKQLNEKRPAPAYDLTNRGLPEFYNRASEEGVKPNDLENELKDLFASLGIIQVYLDGRTTASGRASSIISCAQDMGKVFGLYDRKYAIDHELNHALNFTNKLFKASIAAAWRQFSEPQIDAIRARLISFSDLYEDRDPQVFFGKEATAYLAGYKGPKDSDGFKGSLLGAEDLGSKEKDLLQRIGERFAEIYESFITPLKRPDGTWQMPQKVYRAIDSAA